MARIYVDSTCSLAQVDHYQLSLTLADGQLLEKLEPRRLFPISAENTYISLLNEQEEEVALIRDLHALDENSQAAVQACFATMYRIPIITKILDINEKFGSLMWKVETDRGVVSFLIRGRYQTVKRLGKRFRVRDNCDNRYEITDYTKLDKRSQHLLIPYM